MPSYNVYINEELAEEMDREMKRLRIENRSEFFRYLMRFYIDACVAKPFRKK